MLGSGDNVTLPDKTFGKVMIGKACSCGIVGQYDQRICSGDGSGIARCVKFLPSGADFSRFSAGGIPDSHIQTDLFSRNPVHQRTVGRVYRRAVHKVEKSRPGLCFQKKRNQKTENNPEEKGALPPLFHGDERGKGKGTCSRSGYHARGLFPGFAGNCGRADKRNVVLA